MTKDNATEASKLNGTLELQMASVGVDLARAIGGVLDAIPGGRSGPVDLARSLGIDKVLASRVLKADRNRDPMAFLYLAPGPEPLRRLVRLAARHDVPAATIAAAERSIAQFEELVRQEAGDRSALEAMISGWLPEARAEFELRRKQAAFRALSQLRGAAVDTYLSTAIVHPSEDPAFLDIVWLLGFFGLQRLRSGSPLKFATRRMAGGGKPRQPQTLEGRSVLGLDGLRLDAFCSVPPPSIAAHPVGEIVHYTLAEAGFGPRSATDLVFAEVNRAELSRCVPPPPHRKRYVFVEVNPPAKVLVFDALVHEDVLTSEPALFIYDTAFDGVADVNDRARDIDRLDLLETIRPLGRGIAKFRTTDAPRYSELLQHVCGTLGWDGERFRGFRCRIDYPLYGSQVVMAFDAPVAAG